jgi:hypothetical protein
MAEFSGSFLPSGQLRNPLTSVLALTPSDVWVFSSQWLFEHPAYGLRTSGHPLRTFNGSTTPLFVLLGRRAASQGVFCISTSWPEPVPIHLRIRGLQPHTLRSNMQPGILVVPIGMWPVVGSRRLRACTETQTLGGASALDWGGQCRGIPSMFPTTPESS